MRRKSRYNQKPERASCLLGKRFLRWRFFILWKQYLRRLLYNPLSHSFLVTASSSKHSFSPLCAEGSPTGLLFRLRHVRTLDSSGAFRSAKRLDVWGLLYRHRVRLRLGTATPSLTREGDFNGNCPLVKGSLILKSLFRC